VQRTDVDNFYGRFFEADFEKDSVLENASRSGRCRFFPVE